MWNPTTPGGAIDMTMREDFQLLYPMPDRANLSREIRFYMNYFQANRLSQSTKWLGELLITLQQNQQVQMQDDQSMFSDSLMTDNSMQKLKFTDEVEEEESKRNANQQFNKVFFEKPSETTDILNLARSLFDLREYRKCANILKPLANHKHQSALFLHHYSVYLVSEQQKEEEILQSGDKIQCSTVTNKELIGVEQELRAFYDKHQLNGINLYLFGVVLRERNKKEEAKEVLLESLKKCPLLWSSWLELGSLVEQKDTPFLQGLKEHWMLNFYYANFFLEIHQEKDCINLNGALIRHFPNSVYLYNQIAHASYTSQEYDIALDWFQKLILLDPYRYENMDLYSNILYIKENFGDLAHLAYKVFHNDKYRPESCCVIGNYYSLRGDHHKAVIYFRRAIKLDNKFLSAWTLMGHEYLEMKNTNAAIDSYRSAVDIDPKDFRAWYGLGPQDSRMWNAMGNCYEKMDRKDEAVKCHERAERFKDKEGIALHKLAKLYLQMNENEKAAICFKENLKRKDQEEVESSETTEALMFLAKFYKAQNKLDEAVSYARRLHDFSGTEREEASALIREINNIAQFQHNQLPHAVHHPHR